MCTCTETTTAATTTVCTCAVTETIINPKTVTPISATDEASNKYSIDTEIKARNGNGAQTNTRTGTATGATAVELVSSTHADLLDSTIEIIRSIVGDTYTSADVTAGTTFVSAAHLSSLAAFQTYFNGTATTDLPSAATTVTATQLAQINYITQVMYPIFLSIEKHVEGAEESIVVCTSGSSRVFQVSVKNCLFCLKLIFN